MQQIQKKTFESAATTLTISDEELDDIIKIVKSLEESVFFIKGVNEIIENEVKVQRVGDKKQIELVRIFNAASSFN